MVARKELRMTATRTYLIATAIGPLVVIALIVLPVLLVRNQVASSLDGRVLAVVAAESMVPAVRAEFTPLGVTVEKADEESGLADRVRAGELDGYVVFPADGIGTEHPRYVTSAAVDTLRRQVSDAIGRTVVRRRLELAGLDDQRISDLTRLPQVQELTLREQDQIEQDPGESLMVVIMLVGVLFMMLEVYGQALGRAVAKEKAEKTAEIMLSSLPPFELLAGKVLGKGIAGLIQYLAWLLVAVLAVEVIAPRLGVTVPPFVSAGGLLAALVFFALGFLLYSAVYAIAGAIAGDAENFSQLIWPVFIVEMLAVSLAIATAVNPDGPLAVTLSLIPVTAPIVMVMRVFIGNPGAVQVAAAAAGVALLTIAAVWAAAKTFRLGILLTGNKATFGEIARLLRS